MKRYAIMLGSLVLIVALAIVWLQHRGESGPSGVIPPHVLPQNDRQQIIVDPRRHVLTIVTEKGTQNTYLPDRPTVIDLRKNGDVVVKSPQYGLQVRPYVGLSFSDDARGALGLDLFYWKRLNVGAGMALRFDGRDGRLYLAVSYNVASNLFACVTFDHKQTPGAMLALRF